MNIEDVLKQYFQGYLGAESHQVSLAFHPETRLFSVDDGKLDKTEMAGWLKNLDDRKAKGDIRNADTEILSIDITENAAMAKVRLTFPKYQFTDYLSLLQIEGSWRIVGKIYTVRELN
jgi:hypothetical protein